MAEVKERPKIMRRFSWPAPRQIGAGLYAPWSKLVADASHMRTAPFECSEIVLEVRVGADAPAYDPLTMLAWCHRALNEMGVIPKGAVFREIDIYLGSDGDDLQVSLWESRA